MKSTLGSRLSHLMDLKGMTAAELARRAKTSEATVSNWVNDSIRPEHVKAVSLFSISDALGVSPRALLFNESQTRVAEDSGEYLPSHPVQLSHLTLALEATESVLAESGHTLKPMQKAEAIALAYDLIEEGVPMAKIIRFVKAAVA